jgi:hypothetical protein
MYISIYIHKHMKARLELSRGAVDYLVSGEYCTRPPQEQLFIFVVDISKKACNNGSSLASLRAVKAAIKGSAFKEGVRVGMITFDEKINFYRVNTSASGLSNAVSVLVVDRNDPVPALPLSQWLFPLGGDPSLGEGDPLNCPSMNPLLILIGKLERQYSVQDVSVDDGNIFPLSQPLTACCPLRALQAAQLALADTGGGHDYA